MSIISRKEVKTLTIETPETIQYFTRLDAGKSSWYSIVTEDKVSKEVTVKQLPLDKIPEEIL